MSGQYASQGGFAVEFRDSGVILDCGKHYMAKPYAPSSWAPTQVMITVKNDPAPFTLALQSDGTLTGSGSVDVTGRVVSGSTANGIAFAPRNARCALGVLMPRR